MYVFTLNVFKEKKCWLYDVYGMHVNKDILKPEKKQLINQGVNPLKKEIKELKPEYIVVVKRVIGKNYI